MKTYKLSRTQRVNARIEEVWDFFSDPANLNDLTPDNMSFKITSPLPLSRMYEGQIINYKVAPILNIPLNWKTEIKEVVPYKKFTDIQLKGPYKLWHHVHTFEDKGDHVIMNDTVEYALPFGILGQLAHSIFVKKRLKEIFDYRFTAVSALFDKKSKRPDNIPKALSI